MASSNASVCCSHQSEHSKCNEKSCPVDDLELSVKARKLGALKFSPDDEVEGEIIFYQHRLLGNAVSRNHVTGIHLRILSVYVSVSYPTS